MFREFLEKVLLRNPMNRSLKAELLPTSSFLAMYGTFGGSSLGTLYLKLHYLVHNSGHDFNLQNRDPVWTQDFGVAVVKKMADIDFYIGRDHDEKFESCSVPISDIGTDFKVRYLMTRQKDVLVFFEHSEWNHSFAEDYDLIESYRALKHLFG